MPQNHLFILMLLTAVLASKSGSKQGPISPIPSDIADHFWKTFGPALSPYASQVIPVPNGGPSKTIRSYNNKSDREEHMIVIGLYQQQTQDGNKVFMEFTNCKKAPLLKHIAKYDQDEIEMQSPAFEDFIRQMVTYEVAIDSYDNRLFLNTIEDVRDALRQNDNQKRLKIDQEIVKAEKLVVLRLMYEENHLALLKVAPMKSEKGEFILRVSFTFSKNLGSQTGTADIPVITREENAISIRLKGLLEKLQLNNYVNCNDDNSNQLTVFGATLAKKGKSEKLITLSVDMGTPANARQFTLKYGKEEAKGVLIYVPPASEGFEVGTYQLQITMDGAVVRDAKFGRMPVPDFHEFLKGLKLESLFKSFWEKIQEIFKEKFGKIRESEEKSYSNSDETTGFFDRVHTFTLSSTLGRSHYCNLKFHEKSKEVFLDIETLVKPLAKVSLSFQREDFNAEVVGNWFASTLAVTEAARLPHQVQSSQVKKLLA